MLKLFKNGINSCAPTIAAIGSAAIFGPRPASQFTTLQGLLDLELVHRYETKKELCPTTTSFELTNQ